MTAVLRASFFLLVAARIAFLRREEFRCVDAKDVLPVDLPAGAAASLDAMVGSEYRRTATALEALVEVCNLTTGVDIDQALYDIDYDFLLDVRRHAGVRPTRCSDDPTPEEAAFAKSDIERAYGLSRAGA